MDSAKRERLKRPKATRLLIVFVALVVIPSHEIAAYEPLLPSKPISMHEHSTLTHSMEKVDKSHNAILSQQLNKCLKFRKDTARYIESAVVMISLDSNAYVNDVSIKLVESQLKNDDSKIYIDHFKDYVASAINYCAPYSKLPIDKHDQWKKIVKTYGFYLEQK